MRLNTEDKIVDYWVVGASWGGVDHQDKRFVEQGFWMLGWEQGKQPERAADMQPGDRIVKGDQIGLSGQSGRVTGPHLHFAIMLQGVQVEPMQFLETVNGLFPDKHQKKLMASTEH